MAGQIHEAAALLNKAMEKDRAYLDAYLQYAFRQQDDADIRQSIAVLEEVGHAQPDVPDVYVYLGILNSYLKDFKTAAAAWILAGGAHHTSFSYAVTSEHLQDFAEMAGIELVLIDAHTCIPDFKKELHWNDLYYSFFKSR
jgi:L-arabinose isomerase